jgi:thymidylate synthase
MYQRSGDLFLGIPFNIASTSLLVHIIAQLVGLEPGTVNLIIGDYHIYTTHIDGVIKQLSRCPNDLPKLTIPPFKTLKEVEESTFIDYVITDYKPHSAIKAQMVA